MTLKQTFVATAALFSVGHLAIAQPPELPPAVPPFARMSPLIGQPVPSPVPFQNEFFFQHRPGLVRDYSWIFIDEPAPQEIKEHDIITIIVNEKSEVTMNSRFNRQRNASLKAELKEFIRLNDDGNLAPAALNQPTIDGNLQSRIQSNGQLADEEGIRYRIAAMVVDVRPNGNLVLEARKEVRSNRHESWEYTLTGELPARAINRDMTALSENIYALSITKKLRGKVNDSTKRPWGVLLYDMFSPF